MLVLQDAYHADRRLWLRVLMPVPDEFSRQRQWFNDHFLKAQRDAELEVSRAAATEREYRKLEAQLWTQAPKGEKRGEWTAVERDAWVSAQSADLRYERDLALGLARSKFKYLDFLLADMSMAQPEMNSFKAEAKASGWDGQP